MRIDLSRIKSEVGPYAFELARKRTTFVYLRPHEVLSPEQIRHLNWIYPCWQMVRTGCIK